MFKNGTREHEQTATDRLEVTRAKLVRRSYKKLEFSRWGGEHSPLPLMEFNEKPHGDFKVQEAQKERADPGVIYQKKPGEEEYGKATGK